MVSIKTNPTGSIGRFFDQLNLLFSGAVDEFNLAYLLIGLIPFFFYSRMQKRERGWLMGMVAMYLGLAVLLIVLLNPSSDRQSREQHSHTKYEARICDAEAHRATAEKRNAARAARGKVVSPLPMPSAASAPR